MIEPEYGLCPQSVLQKGDYPVIIGIFCGDGDPVFCGGFDHKYKSLDIWIPGAVCSDFDLFANLCSLYIDVMVDWH